MTRRLLALMLVVLSVLVMWPAGPLARGSEGDAAPTPPAPQWYGPYGGWGWGVGIGWGWPGPYPYPYWGYYDTTPELRLSVTPRETEVYVDGALAGIVNQYDGQFQRLHMFPGDHEITLYLKGFQSWSEHRYFAPQSDNRVVHTMQPLAPGQPDDPKPVPPQRAEARPAEPRVAEQPRVSAPPERPQNEARGFGTLSVGIQPGDAEIMLNGEKLSIPKGQERLIVQLPEGVHRLVIQKGGFQTWETDLQIRRGRTLAFDVTLVK